MVRGLLLLLRFTGAYRLLIRLMLDRRVPLGLKMLLPAAVAYIILPFDLVPDFLPLLGRIDDLLALLLALVLFVGLAPRDVVTEHLRGGRESKPATSPQDGHKVIDGKYRVVDDDR